MGEWRYSSTILDLGIRWIRLVNFAPLQLYPPETAFGTYCRGVWLGSRIGLDVLEKRKYLAPTGKRTP
jgi:hypothetical protein